MFDVIGSFSSNQCSSNFAFNPDVPLAQVQIPVMVWNHNTFQSLREDESISWPISDSSSSSDSSPKKSDDLEPEGP
jgi:hypothetical protein